MLVQQVIDRLRELGAISVRNIDGVEETVHFPLPHGPGRPQHAMREVARVPILTRAARPAAPRGRRSAARRPAAAHPRTASTREGIQPCSTSTCCAATCPPSSRGSSCARARSPFSTSPRSRALEAERKTLQIRTEELQARRNSLSKQIGQLKGKGEDTSAVMAEVAGIGDELKAGAERLEAIQARAARDADGRCPTCRTTSVPVGADETANVEVRRWGTPRAFDFAAEGPRRPRRARWASTSRPAPSSAGSRFTFLRGPAARLHRALAQFMLDVQTREHGYTECYTPYIVNREILEGTGQLPKFKEDMFWVLRGGDEEQRRAVPDLDLGDLADQHRARADPEGRGRCRSSSPRTARASARRPAAPGATRAA